MSATNINIETENVIFYTLWVKKANTLLVTILRVLLFDFQNSFTARLSTKFATKWSLHIPPYTL